MRPNLAKPVHQEKEKGREGSNRKVRKREKKHGLDLRAVRGTEGF